MIDPDSPRGTGPARTFCRLPVPPCPKCGHGDTHMRHCPGGAYYQIRSGTPDDWCRSGDTDHFHRRCERCDYRWRTDDVLKEGAEDAVIRADTPAEQLVADARRVALACKDILDQMPVPTRDHFNEEDDWNLLPDWFTGDNNGRQTWSDDR